MKHFRKWLVICAALIGFGVLASFLIWPPSADDAPQRLPRTVQATSTRGGPPLNSLPRIAVVNRPVAGLDAVENGWQSEAFHEEASRQLNRLAELLVAPKDLTSANVAPLLVAGFHCGALRPDDTVTEFADVTNRLFVRRAEAGQLAGSARQGAAGIVEAASELVGPMRELTDRRASFKVTRVVQSPEGFETTVHFHASGRGQPSVEQNATWQVRWTWGDSNETPLIRSIELESDSFEEVELRHDGPTWFADCTTAVLGGNESFHRQLMRDQNHWTARVEAGYGMDVVAFHGAAMGDVNGDGLEDVYLCMPGGLPNRLYVQNADGTARDISAEASMDFLDFCRHALLVDLDNDGDQDLAMLANAGVVFLANGGSGMFAERARLPLPSSSYSLAAADYDNDGDVDLFITGRDALAEPGQPRSLLGNPVPYHDANNGGRNVLLSNLGDFQFEDVTARVGLDVANHRFSQAASWEDFDDDGDQDLYVANDFGRNNLYENREGRFVDVAAAAGVEDISAGMSVSWGDYNRDGLIDLYVGNMFSSAGNRVAYQRRFHADVDATTRAQFQRHARGNSLFENAGDGTFRDVSVAAGVTMGRWAWSSNFLDINNDGRQDVVVANGFVTNEDSHDL